MTLHDLERLAFLLRSRLALPNDLAGALEVAIRNCLEDPAGRSIDYWLALPPRAPRADLGFAHRRNNLYRNLASTIGGTTHNRSLTISADIEIWLEGQSPATSFGAAFEEFLREYRELEPPHLKQTALRAVIT